MKIDPNYMTGPLWLILGVSLLLPLCYFTVALNMERTRRRYERMKREAEEARRRHRNRL